MSAYILLFVVSCSAQGVWHFARPCFSGILPVLACLSEMSGAEGERPIVAPGVDAKGATEEELPGGSGGGGGVADETTGGPGSSSGGVNWAEMFQSAPAEEATPKAVQMPQVVSCLKMVGLNKPKAPSPVKAAGKPVSAAELARQEGSTSVEDIRKVVDRNILSLKKGMPSGAIDAVEVDGLKMRDRMVKDRIELLNSGRRRADSSYLPAVRRMYLMALTGGEKPLAAVAAGTAALPAGFKAAIEKTRAKQRRNRSKDALSDWLWANRDAPSKEMVAELVDVVLETAASSLCGAQLVLNIYTYLSDHDCFKTYEHLVKPSVVPLQTALCTVHAEEKRKKPDLTLEQFVKDYGFYLSRIFSKQDLDTALEATDWSDLTMVICRLASAGELGLLLFAPFLPNLVILLP